MTVQVSANGANEWRANTSGDLQTIIMLCVGAVCLLAALGASIPYLMQRHYQTKMQEAFLRQTISANPEYVSEIDVYQVSKNNLFPSARSATH